MVASGNGEPGPATALEPGTARPSRAGLARLLPRARLRGPLLAALLGVGLTLPSLGQGLSVVDDFWQQQLILERLEGRGGADPWYAIFDVVTADADTARRERLEGIRPWWSLDSLRIRFLRPLAAASHYVDNFLYPTRTWAMHLHSVLWYGLACFLVGVLYRRLCTRPGMATAAMVLFAIDDAHHLPASWIANRNAVMATCFVVGALIVHDRHRRDGFRPGAWLSPLLFALALACSESGIAGAAFFLAHALYFGEAPTRPARLAAITPHLGVAVLYLLVHHGLGYGAHGSGVYVNPLTDPGAYLAGALPNLHAELYHQVSGGRTATLAFAPAFVPLLDGLFALVLLPPLAIYVVRQLGRSPVFDFGLVAGLLSLAPHLGLPPHERTLLIPGIGLWLCLAQVAVAAFDAMRHGAGILTRALAGLALAVFVLLHGVASPLSLAAGATLMGWGLGEMAALAPTLDDPPLRPDHVITVLNAPDMETAILIPAARQVAGLPTGERVYRLATTPHEVQVYRLDERTLQLSTPFGFIDDPSARFWRDAGHPLHAGDRLRQGEIDIEVARMTHDHKPQIVRFRYARDLDDPGLRFVIWVHGQVREVRPPAIGEARIYPARYDLATDAPFSYGADR